MGWFFNSDSSNEKQSNKRTQQDQLSRENKNYQIFQNVKSYSSSRSCRTDPQNEEYMICSEKINEGGKINTKQTRVHISQANSGFGGFPSIFSHLWHFGDNSYLSDSFSTQKVDNRLQKFDKDILNIEPTLLPFLMMFDPKFIQNFQRRQHNNLNKEQSKKSWMSNHLGQKQQKSKENHKKSHYFSSQQRDYQIKDL